MKLVSVFSGTKKVWFSTCWLTVLLLIAGLLVACGDETPKNLEVVTASATQVVPEAIATTAIAPATAATSAAVTITTVAASTVAGTTASATTAAVTTATTNTKAAATTVAQTTSAATTKAATEVAKVKPGVLLEPMFWQPQTWNNCAPMSAAMALSYYGVKLTEEQCAKVLRPNLGDKHVQPQELVAFIQKQGFKTRQVENGSLDKLRALLSAGIPVITQQWLYENDDIGHYRVARGYDLASKTFIFNDSMDKKAKTIVSDAMQDKLWKGYDRRYFPVYAASQEATVTAILAEDGNSTTNMNRAIDAARKYAETSPKDIDGWRNLGYLDYAMGDCKSAIAVWEQHLTKMLANSENGPYNRFLWYQLWPIECYNKLGSYQQVIKLAPNEIEKAKVYAEARYELAVALMNTGRKDEAIAQLKKALLDDPNYSPTNAMLTKLGVIQ